MATGCVKIVKRAKEFDPSTGKFIPEEKRAKSVDLFKGGKSVDYYDFVMKIDTLTECRALIKVTQNTFDKLWHRSPISLGVACYDKRHFLAPTGALGVTLSVRLSVCL